MCILYMANPADAQKWRDCLSTLAPQLEFRQWPDIGNPAEVHYILAWEPLPSLVEQFGNLRLLYAAGAGVDQFDLARLPAHVSLIRLVDSSMADIMAEYVLFGVLALHRDILAYQEDQRRGRWQPRPIVHASQRRVGVMGVGNLGRAALDRLQPLDFQLSGWSRSSKEVPGGHCYVGLDELEEFLGQCDIVVNMLPLTSETDGILNAARPSQRVGQRVMALLKRLYEKLHLRVNESKSAVASALGRKFLGYELWFSRNEVKCVASYKAKKRFKR